MEKSDNLPFRKDSIEKWEDINNFVFSDFINENWKVWKQVYRSEGVIAVDKKEEKVWGWGKSKCDAREDVLEHLDFKKAKKPIPVVFLDLSKDKPSFEIPEII